MISVGFMYGFVMSDIGIFTVIPLILMRTSLDKRKTLFVWSFGGDFDSFSLFIVS